MKARRPSHAFWVCLAVLGLGAGCPSPPTNNYDPPPPEEPPRELREIVEAIELNASLLDRVLSSGNVQVTARFTDENDREHTYDLNGRLFYQKPRNFRLDLSHGLSEQVMQIGSNEEDYWLWVEPELQRMWWGRHRHSGKPCANKIMVQPDQLISTLGVGGLPKMTKNLLGPARKHGKNHDILYYVRAQPDGEFRLDREYWVSRSSPYQIEGVKIRDRFGRVSMSALLHDYNPTWNAGPWIPSIINITWPQDGGTFTMRMGSIRGYPEVKPGSFDRPAQDRLPGSVGDNIFQVDADCD